MAVRKLRAGARSGLRSGLLGGVAMLGAGVMLSACSPVQMGAAAIVGNQRISQSTLAGYVTDLQNSIAKYPPQELQISSAQAPRATLVTLLQFAVWNQVAKNEGVSVTPAQVEKAVEGIKQARQQNPTQVLNYGITPDIQEGFARMEVQQQAVAEKINGGKPVTNTGSSKVQTELGKIEFAAIRQLNIKVNPQYGKFDPNQGLVPSPDTLSKPASGAAAGAPAAS